MDNLNEKDKKFSRESLAAALQIWNRAAISLVDIRHNLISPEDPILSYRLPASTFLYINGGKSELRLNNVPYQVSQFGMFHGGQGTELTLMPRCDWTEYYIILYKAGEPSTRKREYARLLDVTNPFRQQYGFVPNNPVFLSELLKKMYEKWKGPTPLNLFYGKTAFYQLVYEIYEELEKEHIPVLQPDIVAMAQHFIEQFYAQSINIQDMANVFNVSYSHLHRIFSRQVGRSPQEYLMEIRLNACKSWLEQSELSMREIARGTGFSNEYHFNRMFVRHVGITPGEYRKKMTIDRRDFAIGNCIPFSYNEKSRVSSNELKGKGDYFMFKQMRSKAVMATALSLMLMLSACGTTSANTSGADSASTSSVTSQVTETEAAESVEDGTRTISTVMGDVEIPVNPQRVACYTWAGDLLALGITPVVSNDAELPIMEDALAGTEMSWFEEPEEVMAADPDLIIIRDKEQYEDYSKIAPTLVVEYDMSLEERIQFFGEVFGIEEKAQEALDSFDVKVEKYVQDFKDAGIYGRSITIMFYNETAPYIYGDDFGFGGQVLYDLLGFQVPEAVQSGIIDTGEGYKQVSWEVVGDYLDADYIQVGEETLTELEKISDNAVWNSIEAVKNNKIITYSRNYDRKSLYVIDKILDYYYGQFMGLEKNE
ncbi:AraC family transcriptional regulator [Konateibacter massiliensis]|uniref:AraC family transcriptional regulator n=1 Tax=Konateibacter massiliensis TaxID=2002841 RepID=UPI000C154523|nr:AraC family transcriptional regulator [Konateibacter massiliensis]